jgi:hypothetical protein
MSIRLRQICLVARALAPVVDAVRDVFGLEVCYRDPGVRKYGLENALFPMGDRFLEIVAPVEAGTAAGRFLERRGGDGGYMVITQVDDLAPRRARCAALGVRVAHEITDPTYHELQLHPRDVGAAMLSFSQQDGGGEAWHPAGPDWRGAVRTSTVAALAGVELQADDPERLARRWAEVLERPCRREDGAPVIALDDVPLRFVPARDGRGEGLAGLDLACADRGAVLAAARRRGLAGPDDVVTLCGMRVHLR